MPFPPSAACRFFDLPPVNLQNLPLHLTKNSFASAPMPTRGRQRLQGNDFALQNRIPANPAEPCYTMTVLRTARDGQRKKHLLSLGGGRCFWRLGGRVCGRGRGVSSVMCFAHDSSFCGRSRGGISPLRRRGGGFPIAPPPLRSRTYKLVLCPTLAGRGGSVSRRDHNQAYRRRAQLSGGTNSAETTPPNASRSSGEGVWGRGASLREAASPPASPKP